MGISEIGETIDLLGNTGDSLVIIDTWNSSCGACFRLIPQIDSLAEKLPHVKFLSLNYPLPRDTAYALEFTLGLYQKRQVIDSRIKVYRVAPDTNKDWVCPSFPTFFLVQRNKILFKGSYANCMEYLEKNALL